MSDLGFANRLRAARAAANIQQKAVAAVFSVTPETVANWEHGRATPSAEYIGRLALLYRVSTDWLFTGVAAMPHRFGCK